MPADHGSVVLAGILAGRRDLLDLAVRRLRPAHFTDQVQQNMFSFLVRYHDLAGGVLGREALEDILRRGQAPAGTLALYLQTYDLFSARAVPDDEFRYALDAMRESAAERATGEAITAAYETLTRPTDNGRPAGHAAARSVLLQAFAAIDSDLNQADAPEGDMRLEAQQILETFATAQRRKAAGLDTGVAFGIPALDAKLGGGLRAGELDLIAGYTSSGKTSSLVQLAWHACVMQRLNVVFFTSETLREQVRVKLLARHSRHPALAQQLPDGLNSAEIKAGTLTPVAQYWLQQVVSDFTTNQGYGTCYLAQVPWGATMPVLEQRLARIGRQFPVHLVIIDYLQLIRSDRARPDLRQELGEIVKAAKQLAATFSDGTGVPVVSPWQLNRASRDRVLDRDGNITGLYTMQDLAETHQASTDADVILTLLEPGRREGREAVVKVQVLKNRDGEIMSGLDVRADYATSWWRAAGPAAIGSDVLGLGSASL